MGGDIISLIDKFINKETEASHLLICKSLSNMLRAEKILRQQKVQYELMPVPRGFGSPCKTAIIFPTAFKAQIEQIVKENNIEWQGIYPLKAPKRKLDWSSVFTYNLGDDFASIMEKAREDIQLSEEEIVRLLKTTNQQELNSLYTAADLVRQECVGDRVDIRGAIEFSNYCRKNCKYCGLRRDNINTTRYRMTPDEILEKVKQIADMGLRTVILQSGEDPWYSKEIIVELIKKIKSGYGLRITLSLGERDLEELHSFREAGANNYLLKIESANRILFNQIHPDDDYDVRINNIRTLKEAGFLVGSGNIVGLPQQSFKHLAEDVIFHKEKGIHMIGTGPFIPADNTPYAIESPGSIGLSLKMIAIYRLVCQNVYIPATTALATLDPNGLAKGLKAGANTVMLIMTPSKYRARYNIYNYKKPVGLQEVLDVTKSIGRKLPYYLERNRGGEIIAENAQS